MDEHKVKTLCDLDDLTTMIVVDSFLEVNTRKMNTKFRTNKILENEWKSIIKKFSKKELNYEESFNEIIGNSWVKSMVSQIINPTINKNVLETLTSNDEGIFKNHLFRFLHLFDEKSGITIESGDR